MLRKAAESGKLGIFQVNSSSINATQQHGFKSAPATSKPTPGDCTVCPLSTLTDLVVHSAFKFLFGHEAIAIASMLLVDR